MYNGVGLSTPRGSGTNGHTQRNVASVKKKAKLKHKEETKTESLIRPPNKEILEHTRKREIEVKCLELSDTLEEQGYTEDEVETKVKSYRKILLENHEKMYHPKPTDALGKPIKKESHQTAETQLEKSSTLKDTLHLSESSERKSDRKNSFPQEDSEETVESKQKKIKC